MKWIWKKATKLTAPNETNRPGIYYTSQIFGWAVGYTTNLFASFNINNTPTF
jgi:hypothetical protein